MQDYQCKVHRDGVLASLLFFQDCVYKISTRKCNSKLGCLKLSNSLLYLRLIFKINSCSGSLKRAAFVSAFVFQAIRNAVWLILKAKRRKLRYPDGFMSHFYALMEHLSPVLAWGFLGPESNLKRTCFFFKVNQSTVMIVDSKSFISSEYSTGSSRRTFSGHVQFRTGAILHPWRYGFWHMDVGQTTERRHNPSDPFATT